MNDFLHKYGVPDVHFDSHKTENEELRKNLNLTNPLVDRLISTGRLLTHQALITNPSAKLTDDHIHQMIKKDSVLHWQLLDKRKDEVTPSHIDAMLDSIDSQTDMHEKKLSIRALKNYQKNFSNDQKLRLSNMHHEQLIHK